MSDSGILDFSKDAGEPEQPTRRRRWVSRTVTLLLILGSTAVVLFGGWLHFQQAHDADLAAFDQLVERVAVLDRIAPPLLHGESPPCQSSVDFGLVTRTYSAETGPTPAQLGAALQRLGFSPRQAPEGVLLRFVDEAEGRPLVVDVSGSSADTRGASLRATSDTTYLACQYG